MTDVEFADLKCKALGSAELISAFVSVLRSDTSMSFGNWIENNIDVVRAKIKEKADNEDTL